ncbi:unnamed protein product, partial [Ilex paraguariensis]
LKVERIEKREARTIKDLISSEKLAKYDFGPLVHKKLPVPIRRPTPSEDSDFLLEVQDLVDINPMALELDEILRIKGKEAPDPPKGDQIPKVTSTIEEVYQFRMSSMLFHFYYHNLKASKEFSASPPLPSSTLERRAISHATMACNNSLADTWLLSILPQSDIQRSAIFTANDEVANALHGLTMAAVHVNSLLGRVHSAKKVADDRLSSLANIQNKVEE